MSSPSVIHLTQGRRIVNPDGTTNISCRQCGRIICRVRDPMFTSVTQCAICQGAPEENVISQYVQQNPTQAPLPKIAIQDEVVSLYEDENIKSGVGKWGFLRPLFKVTSWLAEAAEATAVVSKAIVKRKRRKGLLEPYDPEAPEE